MRAETSLEPVFLAFAFDVSGSMGKGDEPWHDRTLKWEPVVAATRQFLEAPAAAGLTASMTFFPADGDEDERCEDETYAEPDVPMTDLPSPEFGAALDVIGAEDWRGGTPTLHVARGTIAYVQAQRAQQPGKYAIVLVTDGYPQGCDDEEISELASIVSGVAAELPTYVIGVQNPPIDDAPDTTSNLQSIAEAGGTEHAYLIDTGDPSRTASAFSGAIDAIRGAAVACTVEIPLPPDGRVFDKEASSCATRTARRPRASPTIRAAPEKRAGITTIPRPRVRSSSAKAPASWYRASSRPSSRSNSPASACCRSRSKVPLPACD